VKLDGRVLKPGEYQLTENTLLLRDVPKQFVLEIETQNKPQENTSLSGLYKSSGNFCTQCEPEGFRRITYFLDRPDVMSSFTTTITADKKRYPVLLSMATRSRKASLPRVSIGSVGKILLKKPSYLFALVGGDLEHIEDFL